MPTLIHLDSPSDGLVRRPVTAVHGWIAVEAPGTFDTLRLVNDAGMEIPLAPVDRPDVRQAVPDRATTGFSGWIDIREAVAGPWRLRYATGRKFADAPLSLKAEASDARRFAEAKARKLDAFRPLLRCPLCRTALADEAGAVVCENQHRFRRDRDAYDFLTSEIRERAGATRTNNVSDHGYDQSLLALIAQADGPVLDVGAGLRPEYRDDVVNLEIVPYPTTDVVAASEYLPFADESFGLVISVAALEHVRDPFATAREHARVLRTGGRIFAAVPFLQPYHGYPSHYYNMTADGLRNLFPDCDVERLDVPASGHPIFALSWILAAWKAGLPPVAAAAFDTLTVRDLAVDPMTLLQRDFVTALSPAAQRDLAALNVLVARKR